MACHNQHYLKTCNNVLNIVIQRLVSKPAGFMARTLTTACSRKRDFVYQLVLFVDVCVLTTVPPLLFSSRTPTTQSQNRGKKMQAAAFRTSLPRAGAFSGSRVAVAPQRAALLAPTISRRGTVQVVAAEEQNKKRTPQSEKRAALALDRRSRNRSRKSAIATRTKKVCAIQGLCRGCQCDVWFAKYSKILQFVQGGRMGLPVHQHFSSNHITAAAAMLLGARATGHRLLL
jgi:hypothetical protein